MLGDLAERIAWLHGVGRPGRGCRSRPAAGCLNVGDDVGAPVGYGLERVPDLVRFFLCLRRPLEIELAVALFSRALHSQAFRRLDGKVVLIAQSHTCLLRDLLHATMLPRTLGYRGRSNRTSR